MYSEGKGVPKDDAEAVGWWRKAAEPGYAKAQSKLGVMYDNGKGVPQDYVQAHMWFNLAASNLPPAIRDLATGRPGTRPYFFGFHSRASFWASAICAPVIFAAIELR